LFHRLGSSLLFAVVINYPNWPQIEAFFQLSFFMQVLPLVVLFIAAFSLSLSLLMPLDEGFKNVPISLLTTFVMMTGELDYRDTFLVNGTLHVLQKILLVFFILVMSISVMNLLTGLAVGDTNEIMNRSKEERRIYKVTHYIVYDYNKNVKKCFSTRTSR
jgi:hypothetical protein